MFSNGESWLLGVVFVLSSVLGGIFGMTVGSIATDQEWEAAAVAAGVGNYETDKRGRPTFVWKTAAGIQAIPEDEWTRCLTCGTVICVHENAQ